MEIVQLDIAIYLFDSIKKFKLGGNELSASSSSSGSVSYTIGSDRVVVNDNPFMELARYFFLASWRALFLRTNVPKFKSA